MALCVNEPNLGTPDAMGLLSALLLLLEQDLKGYLGSLFTWYETLPSSKHEPCQTHMHLTQTLGCAEENKSLLKG